MDIKICFVMIITKYISLKTANDFCDCNIDHKFKKGIHKPHYKSYFQIYHAIKYENHEFTIKFRQCLFSLKVHYL